MKTTKIYFLPYFILSGLFSSFLFYACDVFQPDADALRPVVSVTGKEIFVTPQGSAFIDLNSLVRSNGRLTLTVTSTPRFGKLNEVGNGLLYYSPETGSATGKDSFTFTSQSENSELIRQDTVVIIIEKDSTRFPCAIYPAPDYVYGVKPGSSYTIPVLANDYVCGYDTADLLVDVHHPDNTFPPAKGTAVVKNKNVIYQASPSFSGGDQVIYKILTKGAKKVVGYGLVHLSGRDTCELIVNKDLFTVTREELKEILLPVFDNDHLCDDVISQYKGIYQHPKFGKALVREHGILYTVDPASIGSFHNDFFYYEVCVDTQCKYALVEIMVEQDSGHHCRPVARDDAFTLTGSSQQVFFLDVMKNDTVCDSTSLGILQSPYQGVASTSEHNGKMVIRYEKDATSNNDSLQYRICGTTTCSDAWVRIKRKP